MGNYIYMCTTSRRWTWEWCMQNSRHLSIYIWEGDSWKAVSPLKTRLCCNASIATQFGEHVSQWPRGVVRKSARWHFQRCYSREANNCFVVTSCPHVYVLDNLWSARIRFSWNSRSMPEPSSVRRLRRTRTQTYLGTLRVVEFTFRRS